MYVYIYLSIYLCIYVSMYLYIYIYTYLYIFIYIACMRCDLYKRVSPLQSRSTYIYIYIYIYIYSMYAMRLDMCTFYRATILAHRVDLYIE